MPVRSDSASSRAVTLLEIIVSLLILSLVMAGLANLFVSSKRWAGHSGSRLAASGISSFFLDSDQLNVSEDEWGSNSLGTMTNFSDTFEADGGLNYTVDYSFSPVVNKSGNSIDTLRKVVLRISWNETAP